MEIFKQIAPLMAFLHDVRKQGRTIGLVPTMGALHQGHLELIKASKKNTDLTVASVYVNPTQFNNPRDLSRYPRTLDKDTLLLQEVQCDVLFCPEDSEMYSGTTSLKIDFGTLDKVMEGEFRPGHFSGVGVVVSKLFNIVQPDIAFFGQKDWQQFAVISKLVYDLKFNIKLQSVPTVRETNGLAMSSRNQRLSEKQREDAAIFYKALSFAVKELRSGKEISEVKDAVKRIVNSINGVVLEYFEVADSKNLNPITNVSQSAAPVLCIAGFVGQVRLIDNVLY